MTWTNSTKHWTGNELFTNTIMNHMASLRAITQYHMLKMDEVNKIIKEYWMIYRGGGDSFQLYGTICIISSFQSVYSVKFYIASAVYILDIDNIEIESSHEADSSSIAKRRVYNYRVKLNAKQKHPGCNKSARPIRNSPTYV